MRMSKMTITNLLHIHKTYSHEIKVNIVSLLSKVVLNVANYQFVPAVRVRCLSYITVQLCIPRSSISVTITPIHADHLDNACE